MEDILHREINDGDFCIGMAIGRNSPGMRFGVAYGESLWYRNGSHSSCWNTYLIENPNEEELKIKEECMKAYNNIQEEKIKKAQIKAIPLKEMVVGRIYKTIQGDHYMFLGKRKVNSNLRWNEIDSDGYCYARVWYEYKTKLLHEPFIEFDVNKYGTTSCNILVQKTPKKLVEFIGKKRHRIPN